MKQRVNVRVLGPVTEKVDATGEKYLSQSMIVAWQEKDGDGRDVEQLLKGNNGQKMIDWYNNGGFVEGDDIDVDIRFKTRNGKEGGVYQAVTFYA